MRLWWEVGVRSFRRASTYRLATASGVFTNTIFGYLRASILVFVAGAGGAAIGMTGEELVTFAFVSQGFLMIIGAFGDPELADRIRSGDVVIDLYRPADVQLWWMANWFGRAAFQLLARGLPPVVLGAMAFDLAWPDPWWHWPVFALSVLVASTLGFAIRFCANLSAFWLLDNRGVDQMVTLLMSFFAGLLLPITLFPAWLARVASLLPFASMVQLPVELYLGRHEGAAIVWVLTQQLLWLVALLGLGRALLVAATRRVVIQGG